MTCSIFYSVQKPERSASKRFSKWVRTKPIKLSAVSVGLIPKGKRFVRNADLLAAIVIFANGAKGVSALQVSRDLDVQYKTAFVLSHKLREAMLSEADDRMLSGTVEVDGAYFGGYVKPANRKKDRYDRRRALHQSGKRECVIVARERKGRSLTFIAKAETGGVSFVRSRVAVGARVHADEAPHWDVLHASYDARRINHRLSYSEPGACTNQAESFFSRIRRAEIGVHHHIAGPYLNAYAGEMSWREDNRRMPNGDQVMTIAGCALAIGQSRSWSGYWQRTPKTV